MYELLTNFGIDWKLLLAQVVNFLVLIVILRKFAYQPVIKMLRTREHEIKRGLEASKESQERLAQIKIVEQEELGRARKEALAIVNQAEGTAKVEREAIIMDARKKADVILGETEREIDQERRAMAEEVEGEAVELVKSGVIRVLRKMDPGERDIQLIKEALEELKTVAIE